LSQRGAAADDRELFECQRRAGAYALSARISNQGSLPRDR
jgi:hypothetical protein